MRAHDMFAVAVLNRNGSHRHSTALYRGVVIGGTGGAMAPPDFGRSVYPNSAKGGGQICPPNNTGTPGFSDLPTALTVNTNQLHCLSCQIKVPAVTLIKLQSVV